MRVNQNSKSICELCGNKYMNTEEMYDLKLNDQLTVICKDCVEVLFNKLLKATCLYNNRVKTKEDLERIQRARNRKTPRPTVIEEKLPNCYGDFRKIEKCKNCKFNKECKEIKLSKQD